MITRRDSVRLDVSQLKVSELIQKVERLVLAYSVEKLGFWNGRLRLLQSCNEVRSVLRLFLLSLTALFAPMRAIIRHFVYRVRATSPFV
jgi:hypothetical protein